MWDIEDKALDITPEEFLSALFSKDEMIFFRVFDDKKRGGAGMNMECRGENASKIVPVLKGRNAEGAGVFFVVNGGGQTDKAVMAAGSCRAQFVESDDKTIAEQLEQINSFPLEPSAVVRSKKSLHCYWFLNGGEIRHFRKIQLALVKKFGGDPKIVNESRVMRLPGFDHCKGDPFPVRLIHWRPDLRYTQRELAAQLPNPEPAAPPAGRSRPPGSAASVPDQIAEGGRVNALISQIGKLKHTFLSDDEIRSYITALNATICDPPLSEEELQREVWPAIRRFPSEPPRSRYNESLYDALTEIRPEKRFKWSDIGNGELFAEIFRNELRWNATAKEWVHYDGRAWSEDAGGLIAQAAAAELQKCLLIYSTQIQEPELQKGYQKHVINMASLNVRKRMLEDARYHYDVKAEDFDRDPMLLNLQNGVLDLRSGELLPHDPDLMLSKICSVNYDPEAGAGRWRQFIWEVMQGDEEKALFLQKAAGMALTGETKEETCFLLYGKTTRNGKGTFVETIGAVLGDYALTMSPDTLAKKDNDSRTASPDIARLKGCRFLNASEPDRNMVFDTALLKTLLGRDTIVARFLFQNQFQFMPEFKLFINTNYLPAVKDDTLFASGRIHVVTFDRHFSEEEQDKTLKDKLRTEEEKAGVLNWLVEGLKLYQAEGLKAPECVEAATTDYRLDSDKISNFFEAQMIPERGVNTEAQTVYEQYCWWCQTQGLGVEGKFEFFEGLRDRRLLSDSGTVNGKTCRNVVRGWRFKKSGEFTSKKKDPLEALRTISKDAEEAPWEDSLTS